MLKVDYNKAVALCKESIDGGFDISPDHTSAEGLPFDATQSLRRQMFSRQGAALAFAIVLSYGGSIPATRFWGGGVGGRP